MNFIDLINYPYMEKNPFLDFFQLVYYFCFINSITKINSIQGKFFHSGYRKF